MQIALLYVSNTPLIVIPWHLTGCGDADPHNSLKSASSAQFRYFPQKTEEMPDISDKQLLNILKNIKAEEIDCFETLIFLNIEENTPFDSQD